MIILGIESSCDETAASIIKNGVIVSNSIYSQEIHKKFGGVVPEIASREHDKLLNQMVSDTLNIFIETKFNSDIGERIVKENQFKIKTNNIIFN